MTTITDRPPPTWIAASLERSEAQIESGQTVALDPVLDRLRASIDRMRRKQAQAAARTARQA